MLRSRLIPLTAVIALGGCGSVRTELPSTVDPPPPLVPDAADLETAAPDSNLVESVGSDGAVESVGAGGPGEPGTGVAIPAEPPTTTTTAATATTASAYKSPGEKHPLSGGTLAASYPSVGVRVPRGVAPAPPGQAWAVVNVRFCAAAGTPIDGALVDPSRFRVEVPGQGLVAPAPGAPALSRAPLTAGSPGVAPGTCLEGSIAYLVAGEGHIESIAYDSGAGLLRWAT